MGSGRPCTPTTRPSRGDWQAKAPAPPLQASDSPVVAQALSPANCIFHRFCWGLLGAQQIGEQAIGSRHARRKLPEPRIRGENVDALAVASPDLPAFQRLLTRILRGEDGLVA